MAGESFDIGCGQGQGLAELADRHARAKRRERGDESGVICAVAANDLGDEAFADVAGEVQVDVRRRCHVAVEKPAEEQAVSHRIDVGEAGQVADDRSDRRSAPTARREPPSRRSSRTAGVCDFPGDFQDLAVQQEEPGQAMVSDEREFLFESRERLTSAGGVGVTSAQLVAADTSERRVCALAVGGEVRVVVAQVAGQVELQPLGQAYGLGHGGGVICEPCGGLCRRSQHGVAVAAPLAVGAVQGLVVADRDKRILQERAARVMGVDVAGRDCGEVQRLGELGQMAKQGAVATCAWPLQLHVDVARTERPDQVACGGLGVVCTSGGDEPWDDAVAGATGQADEPGGMGVQVSGVQRRWDGAPIRRRSGGGVSEGDEAAEVGVPGVGLDEERQVRIVGERQLGARDRSDAGLLGGMGERKRSREPIMVGERHRRIPERGGLLGQLLRRGRPVQKAERRVGVQFDIRDGGHERTYVRLSVTRSQLETSRSRFLVPSLAGRSIAPQRADPRTKALTTGTHAKLISTAGRYM